MSVPNLDLSGRSALVCGGSAGIGQSTARALAGLGASVTVLARRADRLDRVVGQIRDAGGTADAIIADLDDRASLVAALGTGRWEILINNTGGPPAGKLLQAEPEALAVAFARHVLAAQTLLRICLPHMEARGYGRIVNVLSTSVREPIPNLGVSNTIRGAMASWAKSVS